MAVVVEVTDCVIICTIVPDIFQVAGEFRLMLYIASSGFSDGFGVKYADNTQRITFFQ